MITEAHSTNSGRASEKQFVIFGEPAGLTAAYELTKFHIRPTVIENVCWELYRFCIRLHGRIGDFLATIYNWFAKLRDGKQQVLHETGFLEWPINPRRETVFATGELDERVVPQN